MHRRSIAIAVLAFIRDMKACAHHVILRNHRQGLCKLAARLRRASLLWLAGEGCVTPPKRQGPRNPQAKPAKRPCFWMTLRSSTTGRSPSSPTAESSTTGRSPSSPTADEPGRSEDHLDSCQQQLARAQDCLRLAPAQPTGKARETPLLRDYFVIFHYGPVSKFAYSG